MSSGATGDGGAATSATVSAPSSVAVGADGSVYIVDSRACVRKVAPTGIISTFAGQCSSAGFAGDGGAATSGKLNGATDLAIGPDGSVYIADTTNERIRRVDPTGTLSTVAGTGVAGFSGDGAAATSAKLSGPTGIDVTTDGALYIADLGNKRIRRVGTDGTITTVAGNGSGPPATGNDGPATSAHLASAARVRVGGDGSLYLAESAGNVVRRVSTDGVIRPFAGAGTRDYNGNVAGGMTLTAPMDVAVAPDGSVYITDQSPKVRRVSSRGLVYTTTGITGTSTFAGDGGPAAAATMGNAQGVRIGPDGSLYIAATANNRVRHIQNTFVGFTASTATISVPSSDGRQIYVFDGTGRHQQTVDAFTGTTLYSFGYDTGERLSSVTDVNGDVTHIHHDMAGHLTNIVSPLGQTTTFTADTNGYLATATDPSTAVTQFTYDANGLLLTKTDPRSEESQYTYDSLGKLTQDQDPAGGAKTLAHTDDSTDFNVSLTTSLGVATYMTTGKPYSGSFTRNNTLPSGFAPWLERTTAGVTTAVAADSTMTVTTTTPDPRFGMLSPLTSVVTTTPSGIVSTKNVSRSMTFSGGSLATWLEQTNLNGHTWSQAFNASTHTWTSTSPVGRVTTTVVDSAGRPTETTVSGVTPLYFTYDAHGRLSTTAQGTHTWTQTYDANGNLASTTDPLSHVISYSNDALGRPTTTTLPDMRTMGASYDGDNNTTQLVLPSTEAHDFSFTPVNLLSSYTPPTVSMASPTTGYTYDLDRNLTTLARPDGISVTYGYDYADRLQTITTPLGTTWFGYDGATGYLGYTTTPASETASNSYDGFLKTGISWSGPVSGAVSFGYDSNFRVTTETVAGSAITITYDADGYLTHAGSLTLARDSSNGRLTGTTIGSLTDAYTYDSNGLFATYTASYGMTLLYSESVVRDAVGRITQKTEDVQGTTHVWGYTYDSSGRLTNVTKDSTSVATYGYDGDDNRTTFTNPGGTVHPTYDAQDRLLTYGSTSYTYTDNGELATKTDGAGTTTYTYDALGNLIEVVLPSAEDITYVVDGENRRVGRQVGGTLTSGFLYHDKLHTVAQLDGSGSVVSQFVFGSKSNVPDYVVTSSATLRVLSDHLGSPRLVVDISSGTVVEQIDYDEFGVVTNDTSPGTTPFGFAGGLYDGDTGLVRFGARDYDASAGRWMSKDPLRFGGGMNLYGYVVNDPVDHLDPDGTDPSLVVGIFCSLFPSACGGSGPDSGPAPGGPPDPPLCSSANGDDGTHARCQAASVGSHGDWGAFCNSVPDIRTRAKCWSYYFSSAQEKSNWCFWEFTK